MNSLLFAALVSITAGVAVVGVLHYYDAHVYPPADGLILIDGEPFRPYPHTDDKPEYINKTLVDEVIQIAPGVISINGQMMIDFPTLNNLNNTS